MSEAITILDVSKPDRNMFGALPCPECSSRERIPYKELLECQNCGFRQPYIDGYGKCPHCAGTGEIIGTAIKCPCQNAEGEGLTAAQIEYDGYISE